MIFDAYVDTTASTAELQGVAARALDAKPALALIRELLFAGFRSNWESEGSDFGQPWLPLAPGTLARKARQGQPADPLRASGALEAAVKGGPGRASRVGRNSVRAGVRGRDLFYARFKQTGTDHEPRRPVLGIDVPTERRSATIVERWLSSGRVSVV